MADEEERRPLRHLKFREFENVSGDLTADEIRRLYANKMTELRDNARGNSQALENLKKDKEEEKKEQDLLRKEYIASVKSNLRNQLNNIDVINEKGKV